MITTRLKAKYEDKQNSDKKQATRQSCRKYRKTDLQAFPPENNNKSAQRKFAWKGLKAILLARKTSRKKGCWRLLNRSDQVWGRRRGTPIKDFKKKSTVSGRVSGENMNWVNASSKQERTAKVGNELAEKWNDREGEYNSLRCNVKGGKESRAKPYRKSEDIKKKILCIKIPSI